MVLNCSNYYLVVLNCFQWLPADLSFYKWLILGTIGAQWLPVVLNCFQWLPACRPQFLQVAHIGYHWCSMATSGSQWLFMVLSFSQCFSVVFKSNPSFSQPLEFGATVTLYAKFLSPPKLPTQQKQVGCSSHTVVTQCTDNPQNICVRESPACIRSIKSPYCTFEVHL